MLDYTPYLQRSLELAKTTFTQGNSPVGVLITDVDGNIVAEGANAATANGDLTAHGVLNVLRLAGRQILYKYNPQPLFLFTTLEPCVGCTYFISRTNISKVIWSCSDPRGNSMSLIKQSQPETLKDIELIAEPDENMRSEALTLMRDFYALKGELDAAKLFSESEFF